MAFLRRYKKIFFALAFLGLVFLIGYFLWSTFFRPTAIGPTEVSTSTGSVGGLPSVGLGSGGEIIGGGSGTLPGDTGGGIATTSQGSLAPQAEPGKIASGGLTETKAISDSPVLNPTLTDSGSLLYYDRDDGRFYRLDKNGKATMLSDKVFHQVQSVTWAPNESQAILEYPDGSKILYNFDTKKQVTLPSYWQDFSFSPDSQSITAKSIGLDVENRWLITSNSDGSSAKTIEAIGENADDVYPDWSPNKQIIAYYTRGLDFNRQQVFFVGLNDENFKSTIIEGRGLEAQWSTEGNRLLYSVYNSSDGYLPRLWVVDAQGEAIGQNRRSFDLNTWASKCAFASDSQIYCAVPENLEAGAGLFPELADKTKDNLYKIDLTNGSRQLIAVPDGAYNVSDILVSSSQDYLYFTDKRTGQLYSIRLR